MARLMNQRTQTMAKAAPSQSHPSRGIGLWAALHLVAIAVFVLLALGQARAEASQTVTQNVAEQAVQRFAQNCFSPFLTADLAQERLAMDEVRIDFYDLRPFSNVEISPATGRAVTAGTDRRCEIAFDGSFAALAAEAAIGGLAAEGIVMQAPLPDTYTPLAGTELLAARQLNPNRVAVVHAGTRPYQDGTETFIFVERLTPSDE